MYYIFQIQSKKILLCKKMTSEYKKISYEIFHALVSIKKDIVQQACRNFS